LNLPCGSEELREDYEELRMQSLKHTSGGLGLQLFLNRGMAAWISYGSRIPGGKKWTRDKPAQEKVCSVGTRSDIVMILAGMAQSCAEGRNDHG
jgi:hypothetical protein